MCLCAAAAAVCYPENTSPSALCGVCGCLRVKGMALKTFCHANIMSYICNVLNFIDMAKTRKIVVNDTDISVLLKGEENDFISLTDMAKGFEGGSKLIEKWLSTKSTVDFLGAWERINNPHFNSPGFGEIRTETGSNSFYISVSKFILRTNAVGIFAKAGRYGGTFAHKDIAYHFGMWLSPEFNLLVIKEIQRLKESESNPLIQHWDVKRLLSKVNYHIHTDAIKEYVIPKLSVTQKKDYITYAKEADLLNLALFGYTAKEWEESNPELAKKINMRDTASINQLIVLSNMEAVNSEMIKLDVPRSDRFAALHKMAKEQLASLDSHNTQFKFRKLSSEESDTPLLE